MTMKRRSPRRLRLYTLLVGTVFGGMVITATAQEPTVSVEQVLNCMRANVPNAVRVQQVEMEATDRVGAARVLRGRLYAMRMNDADAEVRAMLRIDSPDYLAGAAYLVRGIEEDRAEGMYVYLPSVKRVRRVSGEFADGSLLGTNFSYNDFKQIQNAFGGANAQLLGVAEIAGRPVYQLRVEPLADSASRYGFVRADVDQETCVPLAIDFYEGEDVRKQWRTQSDAIQRHGDYWYPAVSVMQDLKERTQTTLRVLDVTIEESVPGRYFNPSTFHLGG